MKKTRCIKVAALSLLLGATAQAKDYSACAHHFNPEIPSYDSGDRGDKPLWPGMETYMPDKFMPFTLNDDGTLDVDEEAVVNHTKGNPEVIEYMATDPLARMQANLGKKINPLTKMRKVKVLIYRGPNGEMTFKTDFNYNQAELEKVKKEIIAKQQSYLKQALGETAGTNTAEGEAAPQGKPIGLGPLGPMGVPNFGHISIPKGVDLNFSMKNGKCMPARITATTLKGLDLEGEQKIDILSDTKLCRDIEKEFEKNPELKKCFDPKMNKGLADIFKNYLKREPYITKDHSFDGENWTTSNGTTPVFAFSNGGFGSNQGGIFGRGLAGMGSIFPDGTKSTTHQLLLPHLSPFGKAKPIEKEQLSEKQTKSKMGINEYFGVSPSITAAHYLETCRFRGLEKFYSNDDLWNETKPEGTTNGKSDSGDQGAKR